MALLKKKDTCSANLPWIYRGKEKKKERRKEEKRKKMRTKECTGIGTGILDTTTPSMHLTVLLVVWSQSAPPESRFPHKPRPLAAEVL